MADPIEMTESFIAKRQDEFAIKRAQAIADYSELEQMYRACMAQFCDIGQHAAAIILFKISASRARSEILDQLKSLKYGAARQVFWSSAQALGATLADERNKIVHWAVAAAIFRDKDDKPFFDVALKPANYWAWEEGRNELFSADLDLFSAKCEFLGRSLSMFLKLMRDDLAGVEHDTWREICQQPLVYPPIPDHPLFQRPKVQMSPPPTSVA